MCVQKQLYRIIYLEDLPARVLSQYIGYYLVQRRSFLTKHLSFSFRHRSGPVLRRDCINLYAYIRIRGIRSDVKEITTPYTKCIIICGILRKKVKLACWRGGDPEQGHQFPPLSTLIS